MFIKIIKSSEHPVVFEQEVNNFINQKNIIIRDIKYVSRQVANYVVREAMVIYYIETEFDKGEMIHDKD